VLQPLVDAAIAELQKDYLDGAQIQASRSIMGLDTQLIDDGTYFIIEIEGRVAGCGGWSRRVTMWGGDHSGGRDAALLDPSRQPCRVRAMYTHPDYVRRGVGSLILALCESAAGSEGFSTLELVATLAGEPLYRSAGFAPEERLEIPVDGQLIPAIRMTKKIATRR
jgi:GNAT superfamily N-acetyltransferase